MDYYWKIVLSNGKEYVVKDNEKEVVAFMKRATQANTFSDFVLARPIETGYGFSVNTVMIKGNDVSAVEYSIGE